VQARAQDDARSHP